MCTRRFESSKSKVCLSVPEFPYKLQVFYFYSFFSFSWNWYSNGDTANGKKKLSAFRSGMRKLKSLQYFSKMQPFFKHESILYIHFAPITKKSALDIFLTNLLFWPFFSSKKYLFLDLNCLHFYHLLLKLFSHWDHRVHPKKRRHYCC